MPWITSFVNLQSNSVGTFSHDLSFAFFLPFFIVCFSFFVRSICLLLRTCALRCLSLFSVKYFSVIGFSADKSIFRQSCFTNVVCRVYIDYLNAVCTIQFLNHFKRQLSTRLNHSIEFICKFKRFFFRHGI